MSSKPLLFIVRHGHTDLNSRAPKLRAWVDVPLNEEGEIDAQMAANKLAKYNPQMLYHSDLMRDTQTANIISQMLGNIPFEPDFRFRTADMGELSGQPENEVRERVLRWYQNPFEKAPGGESYTNFLNRFMEGIEEKLEIARSCEAFCPTVVVAHGRNLAALHSVYAMIPPEQADMALPGGIAVIRSNPDGLDSFEFLDGTEPVQEDV